MLKLKSATFLNLNLDLVFIAMISVTVRELFPTRGSGAKLLSEKNALVRKLSEILWHSVKHWLKNPKISEIFTEKSEISAKLLILHVTFGFSRTDFKYLGGLQTSLIPVSYSYEICLQQIPQQLKYSIKLPYK